MRRTSIYLLVTALAAAALAGAHAASPREARADGPKQHLWETFPWGETCSGSCGSGQSCCTITPAPAP